MILAAIAVCEIAFWVFLLGGLVARYLFRRRRLGLVLLLGSPAVDLALLLLTAVDLHRGADPTQGHTLAALYLGITVAFGHSMVTWADQRFAHRFAGGPAPTKRHQTGRLRVEYEWREFRKAVLAWGVSCVLLLGQALLIGDVEGARVPLSYIGVLSAVLVLWFVTGPVPAVVRAGRPDASRSEASRSEVSPTAGGGPAPPSDGSPGGRTAPESTLRARVSTGGWAPWWVYLVVILGVNYLRQAAMPVGTVPEWAVVALAVGISGALFVLVTAVYRALHRR